jgi:hypothetical protein
MYIYARIYYLRHYLALCTSPPLPRPINALDHVVENWTKAVVIFVLLVYVGHK